VGQYPQKNFVLKGDEHGKLKLFPAITTTLWCRTSAFWSAVDGNWVVIKVGKLFFVSPGVDVPSCDLTSAVIAGCVDADVSCCDVTDPLALSSFVADAVVVSSTVYSTIYMYRYLIYLLCLFLFSKQSCVIHVESSLCFACCKLCSRVHCRTHYPRTAHSK